MQETITVQSVEITNVFDELVRNMESMRGQEANEKVANAGKGQWGKKPQTFSYCGFLENSKQYFIHEVKNLGGRCLDYNDGSPLNNNCANCRYRKVTKGYAQKKQIQKFLLDFAKPGSDSFRKHESETNAAIANEIRLVYQLNGLLDREPMIFDYCEKFSDVSKGPFAVCAVKNSNKNCPAFESNNSDDFKDPGQSDIFNKSNIPLKTAAENQQAPGGLQEPNEAIKSYDSQKYKEPGEPDMKEQYNASQDQNEGLSKDEISFIEAQTDPELADYLRTVLKTNSKERYDKALKYFKEDPDTYFYLSRLIKKRLSSNVK